MNDLASLRSAAPFGGTARGLASGEAAGNPPQPGPLPKQKERENQRLMVHESGTFVDACRTAKRRMGSKRSVAVPSPSEDQGEGNLARG